MTVSRKDRKFEQLLQEIEAQSKLLRAWPLKGGISAEMTALEIARPDGQMVKLIVRRPGDAALSQNPRAAIQEFKTLEMTQALGLNTPMAYHLDQSGKILGAPCLVIEYIEGQPQFSPSDLDDFILQLATHLAEVHSVDCASLDLSSLPQQTQRCAEGLSTRLGRMDSSLDEGHICETLETAWPIEQRNASTLLHGDFWPGNTLWQDDRLVAVVDWEDAKVGDPLIDLAISRLDIVWIFGVDAMNAFTQHYQSKMTIDYVNLPYWDLCAALRFIRLAGSSLAEWATSFSLYGRSDITEQTMRRDYSFFIAQAFEKLAVH